MTESRRKASRLKLTSFSTPIIVRLDLFDEANLNQLLDWNLHA